MTVIIIIFWQHKKNSLPSFQATFTHMQILEKLLYNQEKADWCEWASAILLSFPCTSLCFPLQGNDLGNQIHHTIRLVKMMTYPTMTHLAALAKNDKQSPCVNTFNSSCIPDQSISNLTMSFEEDCYFKNWLFSHGLLLNTHAWLGFMIINGQFVLIYIADTVGILQYNPIQSAISRDLIGQIFGTE